MPIQIGTRDNEIVLNVYGSTPNFSSIISILKHAHCTFVPEGKIWKISPKSFQGVYDSLSNLERVLIRDKSVKEVEALLNKPTQICEDKIPFDIRELKMPPFKGKPPFEMYQLEDIRSCLSHNRFALFNEQGTGKSYVLINTIELLRNKKGIKKVLFITSPSGVYNIKKEFERFSFIPPEEITVGGVKNRRPFDNKDISIILCNYRSFLLISDQYQEDTGSQTKSYRRCPIPIEEWLQGDKGILVLDESHLVSNPKARQTKALQLIVPKFQYRYIATGSPADKHEKWYSQLKILDPALVNNQSYYEWLEEYAHVGNRFSQYAISSWKPEKIRELSDRIAPHCVRRFSNQVLSLPEHFIRKYYVEFTEFHKSIYQRLVMGRMTQIQETYGALNTRAVINAFPYLILAIDNPTLLLHHDEKLNDPFLTSAILNNYHFENHSKIEALKELLDKHKDEKIVIWTSHPSVGRDLYLFLLHKYNPLLINGESEVPKGMSLDEFKADIIAKFQKDNYHKILIAGEQVLNTSVSLVAANAQIYFDTDFSYTNFDQSLKRVHRIGQNKPVYTYILLIDESLDIVRSTNLEQKDVVNKKFLEKDYISQNMVQNLFNMKGE